MRRAGAVILAVAMAGLVLAAVAAAVTVRHDTTVTIKLAGNARTGERLTGEVQSQKARCVRGRTIVVRHNAAVLTRTRSDSDGIWTVAIPNPPAGSYTD